MQSKIDAAKKFEVFLRAYLKEYFSVDEKDIRTVIDNYSKDLLPLFDHLFSNFHEFIDKHPWSHRFVECNIHFSEKKPEGNFN